MGSMVQHFLMISDSMGKHGEHGNSSFSCLQIAWKSMGSMVQHSLIISDSIERHGEHGKAFSHDFRQHGKHGNSSFSWL